VLAIVAVATARWGDIAGAYHLWNLRRNAGLLEGMLLAGGHRELAAREFVEEPEGRKALFRLYLEEFDRSAPGFSNRDYLNRLKSSEATHGSLTLWMTGYSCQTTTGSTGGSSFSLANVPQDPRRREIILGILDACVGEVFRVPEYGHLEFQIRPVKDGNVDPPRWQGSVELEVRPSPVTPPGVRHVCFYRIVKR